MSPRLATVAHNISPAEQQRLVIENRPLVFKLASELKHTGPAYDDLVQEGCVGLCIAAQKFDSSNGASFGTYAAYWIRACMLACAINTRGPVRFGSTKNQRRIFYNLGRVRRQFEITGVTPTTEQLAAALDVTPTDVEIALPRMSNHDWSLDATYAREDGDSIKMQLADGRARVDDILEVARADAEKRTKLMKAIAALPTRHAEVIRERFLREEPLTLREVGERWRISRERVRQIEMKALTELRALLVSE